MIHYFLTSLLLLSVLTLTRFFMSFFFFFFFNDTATTEIYTLSLHDAFRSLFPPPISSLQLRPQWRACDPLQDRKSTRLNSSHVEISYAVFCLKKKIEEHGHTLSAADSNRRALESARR